MAQEPSPYRIRRWFYLAFTRRDGLGEFFILQIGLGLVFALAATFWATVAALNTDAADFFPKFTSAMLYTLIAFMLTEVFFFGARILIQQSALMDQIGNMKLEKNLNYLGTDSIRDDLAALIGEMADSKIRGQEGFFVEWTKSKIRGATAVLSSSANGGPIESDPDDDTLHLASRAFKIPNVLVFATAPIGGAPYVLGFDTQLYYRGLNRVASTQGATIIRVFIICDSRLSKEQYGEIRGHISLGTIQVRIITLVSLKDKCPDCICDELDFALFNDEFVSIWQYQVRGHGDPHVQWYTSEHEVFGKIRMIQKTVAELSSGEDNLMQNTSSLDEFLKTNDITFETPELA